MNIVSFARGSARMFALSLAGILVLTGCQPPVGTQVWRYEGVRARPPVLSPLVGYMVGENEWQISLGCVEYEFQVKVVESTLERQVYVCEEWISDDRGGTVKRIVEVLDPGAENSADGAPGLADVPTDVRESPGGVREREVSLWDHPVRVEFQVSARFDRVWIDSDDTSDLLIQRSTTALDTEAIRRIYLCESELQQLANIPIEDFEIVLKLELIDPETHEVVAMNVVPLRTRLKRATVLRVLDSLGT